MTLNDIGDFLFRTFALSIRTVGDATDGESAVALMPADTRTLAQKVTMEELLKNFDDKMGALPEDDFQAASD